MLLRNMHVDPARGHCNGTRYIIHHIRWRYITACIACGEYSGNVLLFPPQSTVADRCRRRAT